MKETGIVLAIITAIMTLPMIVEYLAKSDALGPLFGMIILLSLTAALIFALPVKTRR